MDHKPTREEAWKILSDHVKSPNLIAHALAVEAAMRQFARKKGADEELWSVIGLIHDVDYEEHPDEHLRHAPVMLREQGWPPWIFLLASVSRPPQVTPTNAMPNPAP